MEKDQKIELQDIQKKSPSSWSWIIPCIIGVILFKTLGLIGALVTIASYSWLKPKIGTLGSIIASTILGIVTGIGATMLILN